jgi:hypothetical protein
LRSYKRRLTFSQLFGKGDNDLFNYLPPVKDYFLTGSVRGGLGSIIDFLASGEENKVLLPVFIAEGVIRPFKIREVGIIYYKLTDDLNPDIEDIEKQIIRNKDIKFIVVVHYFGFIYDFSQIKNICLENNIILFEDCVHALFSKSSNDEYLGVIGDISFFSLPKILPVPDGAIFFINKPELINMKSELLFKKGISSYITTNLHLIYLILKYAEVKIRYSILYRFVNAISKGIYGSYYFLLNHNSQPHIISNMTLKILKNINYSELISKRKNHIKIIYETINKNDNVKFFKNYDRNAVLTGVPMLSDNSTNIISILKKNMIECLTYKKKWLFLPDDNINEFDKELYFFSNHFLLPVNENDSDYVPELRKVFSE